jgi:hypothetical protein
MPSAGLPRARNWSSGTAARRSEKIAGHACRETFGENGRRSLPTIAPRAPRAASDGREEPRRTDLDSAALFAGFGAQRRSYCRCQRLAPVARFRESAGGGAIEAEG